MKKKSLSALLSALLVPSAVFGIGGDYPAPGGGQLQIVLCAIESRGQVPAGYADLVFQQELLGGHFVNSEEVFYYAGDKQSFEKFLAAYSKVTNVVAHTVIKRKGTASIGPPWNPKKFPQYDWALYCHPYGWLEDHNHKPQGKYVLWIELRVGGKISDQEMYSLAIPAGVQVVYVHNDEPPAVVPKEKEKL